MIIEVTQEDIDNGQYCKSTHCPIALAVKRATEAELVSVGSFSMMVVKSKVSKIYDLPPIAKDLVKDFDTHKEVKPCQFSLEEK